MPMSFLFHWWTARKIALSSCKSTFNGWTEHLHNLWTHSLTIIRARNLAIPSCTGSAAVQLVGMQDLVRLKDLAPFLARCYETPY